MCGVAGYVARLDAAQIEPRLRAMAQAIAHRGPDGEGVFSADAGDGRVVGLAHRRLAIIDLDTGSQPMRSGDGRLTIVFNGEIYNFRELRASLEQRGIVFRTRSDTEVILASYRVWGEACVEHLRGMFAFALWDADARTLFLARDRFGEKPLFIAHTPDGVVFASEIKALLTWPGVSPRLSRDALLRYLQYRYVPGPDTLFEGIVKLGAGCVARWRDGVWNERRYYHPADADAQQAPYDPRASSDAPTTIFSKLLDDAVARTMISDVPIGAFLSGGIDSSTIVACMARHSSAPVRTFSVGFTEAGYSELSYAATVAKAFGTTHQEIIIDHRQLSTLLPFAARHRDAPVAEPADVPIYLLAREARRSVTVALSGEGSDEALGGYPKHVAEHTLRPSRIKLPESLRRLAFEGLADRLPYKLKRAKIALRTLGLHDFEERMARWFGAFAPNEVYALAGAVPPRLQGDAAYPLRSQRVSDLRRVLHFDQTSWLPDNLLERGDRMTMAASLELRLPFLDHRLVEFVASLPDRYRVSRMQSKRILRDAMRDVLPKVVLERPKSGFKMPVHVWLRGELREFVAEHLLSADARIAAWLDRAEVARLVNEHNNGTDNHEKTLWTLLNLEIWAREYRVV